MTSLLKLTSLTSTSSKTPIYTPILPSGLLTSTGQTGQLTSNDTKYIDGILNNLKVLQKVNPVSNNIPVDETKAENLLRGVSNEDRFILLINQIDIDKLKNYDYKKNELASFAKQLGINTTGSIESLSEIIYEKILSYKTYKN